MPLGQINIGINLAYFAYLFAVLTYGIMKIWWFLVLKGLLLLLVGLLFVFKPEEAVKGLSFYLGLFLLAAGIIGLVSIPKNVEKGFRLLAYLAPAVALTSGIVLIFFAEFALIVFALAAGIWIFNDGIEQLRRVSDVSKMDKGIGRWMIFMGILSLLLAVMIFLEPMRLVNLITVFFGIVLIISGAFSTILGFRLRQ